jgi:hypothetical protein
MENELSMLSGVFVAFIPVVATAMEALRSWIDKKKKLKPYWFYIAIALSLAGSAVFSFLTG